MIKFLIIIQRVQLFNKRQIKILDKIFDVGIYNSEKKYVLTIVSKSTASRVIAELIEIGCIKQIIGSREKDERYTIKI